MKKYQLDFYALPSPLCGPAGILISLGNTQWGEDYGDGNPFGHTELTEKPGQWLARTGPKSQPWCVGEFHIRLASAVRSIPIYLPITNICIHKQGYQYGKMDLVPAIICCLQITKRGRNTLQSRRTRQAHVNKLSHANLNNQTSQQWRWQSLFSPKREKECDYLCTQEMSAYQAT